MKLSGIFPCWQTKQIKYMSRCCTNGIETSRDFTRDLARRYLLGVQDGLWSRGYPGKLIVSNHILTSGLLQEGVSENVPGV